MLIRNAHPADLPYLYDICAKTAFNGGDARHLLSDPLIIGQYFLAPYVIFNPDWCWVVEQNNCLLGYLVSTPDSKIFANWMTSNWLGVIRQLYPVTQLSDLSSYEIWLRDLIHRDPVLDDFITDFPAHLHVDLLPKAQGQRLGSRLIGLLEQKLIQQKIPGYHLAMSADNSAGNFYESNGLKILRQDSGVIFYGKRL